MTGAEQRPCLHCGTIFAWTTASPRKRFCTQRCRLAWHGEQRRGKPRPPRRSRRRQQAQDQAAGHGDTAATAPEPPPHGVLAATPACPHCRQPVAIVAWLVPPAAHATTVPRHHATRADTPTRRNDE